MDEIYKINYDNEPTNYKIISSITEFYKEIIFDIYKN